jgi:polysaccharide biosynthesis protein PslH
VATDRCATGVAHIQRLLADRPDVVVVDFPHAGVLVPDFLGVSSVLFTHNVEAEIFRRHAQVAPNLALRWFWKHQTAKMERFEQRELVRYDRIIAISERDREIFVGRYGLKDAAKIPTGLIFRTSRTQFKTNLRG